MSYIASTSIYALINIDRNISSIKELKRPKVSKMMKAILLLVLRCTCDFLNAKDNLWDI